MQRIKTESSKAFQRIAYCHVREELRLVFRSGAEVRYFAVPKAKWDEFRNAPSLGTYYRNQIMGKFESRKHE